MLCSLFSGVSASAQKIKVNDLEKNGRTNKSEKNFEFSKKQIAGAAYALHEFLSLAKGGLLQFYNLPGRLSLSGLYRRFSIVDTLNKYRDIFRELKVTIKKVAEKGTNINIKISNGIGI